jgi:hypothetical protein
VPDLRQQRIEGRTKLGSDRLVVEPRRRLDRGSERVLGTFGGRREVARRLDR